MTMAALTKVRVAIVFLSQAYFYKTPVLEIDYATVASPFQGLLGVVKF